MEYLAWPQPPGHAAGAEAFCCSKKVKMKKKKWSTEHCLSRLGAQEERGVLLLKSLERGC